jgi:pimeloyl-ACP methyl ester carboxylesterase
VKIALVVVGIAVVYQVAVLLAVTLGWRNRRMRHRRDPGSLGLSFEAVGIPTANARTLHGWWIPSGTAAAPCVILVHGWGRNVERVLPYVEMLHPALFDLLAFDARHHGSSDGDAYASMPKFSEDIRAAVDYVVMRRGAAAGRSDVGVLGLSVGGSAAIHAAAHDPRIAAVVTVGAFADPADARATIGPHWWLLAPGLPLVFWLFERRIGMKFREISPEKVIARARARFLLIHGTEDAVVPVAHVRRLVAAAGASARTWIIPGRGHSDPHLESGMAATLAGFFGEALLTPPGRAAPPPARPAPPSR